ncbi:pilin [Lentzea sp. BCCO 10_0061]|uniref:Pilin n=1 Tax=Lentzea sokolovensis TaxID=3095429 RepID=A0ABU4UX26_9PSEU|nr:pilin [Lentzea sp. BCCO 10_0061]MDX8143311.1 pilin [Lentzea sp. BCCO 10_0061]
MRLISLTAKVADRPHAHQTSCRSISPTIAGAPTAVTETECTSLDSTPMSDRRRDGTQRPRLLLVAGQLLILAFLLSASSAQAETVHTVALVASVDQVLTNIRNWIMGILAALATVFLSIAFVRRMTGAGDPGEIEKAKTAFRSACWGYLGALSTPLVIEVLKGFVGA